MHGWISFEDLVRRAFSARRKKLRNALPFAPQNFDALRIGANPRHEDLSPGDYVRLAQHASRIH